MLRSLLIAELFRCERLSHQGEHEPQNEQQVGPCIYRPLLEAQEESLFNQRSGEIVRGEGRFAYNQINQPN